MMIRSVRLSEKGRVVVIDLSFPQDFHDFVRTKLSRFQETRPGRLGKASVSQEIEEPLIGIIGLLLPESGLDLEEPFPVIVFLRSDHRRNDYRNPQCAVERELARLCPENVRRAQNVVEARIIL